MINPRPRPLALLALGLLLTMTLPFVSARAHHSASAFDRSKVELVTGTVRKFLWANPHVWVYLDVPNANQGTSVWLLEGPPPTMLVRAGWNGETLTPGKKVSLIVAPYRNGSKGGEFILENNSSPKKQ